MPITATEDFVESKIRYLANVGVWPRRQDLDPYPWLQNFTSDEHPYALNLLNVFLYFNDSLIDAMFHNALQRLSARITEPATSLSEARQLWISFLDSVVVTYIEGETPNATDSGRIFAGKARRVLGIDQVQILEPAQALAQISDSSGPPVLLVDDFVGSGEQTIKSWKREYVPKSAAGVDQLRQPVSLESASALGASITYIPLVATRFGLNAVAATCSDLRTEPVHTLGEEYSLANADSVLWPEPLRASAQDFLYSASERAGIVGDCEFGWKGFSDLALALAFSHTVPDATLPLYFWEGPGWSPLVRRT